MFLGAIFFLGLSFLFKVFVSFTAFCHGCSPCFTFLLFSVMACGVGGLPRRRYSLHVRAVVRPSRLGLSCIGVPNVNHAVFALEKERSARRSATTRAVPVVARALAQALARPLGLNAGVAPCGV